MLIASVAGQISGQFIEADRFQKIVRLLNVDAENNLPSTYSSFALLLCGLIIAVIAGVKHKQRDRFAFHWKCLSLIFLYLSIDEAASLHELSVFTLRQLLGAGGFLYFTWVIPGAIFVIIFVLAYLKFLLSLPTKTRNLFVTAGTIFVGGAIGV